MLKNRNVPCNTDLNKLARRFHSLAWICHQNCFNGFWSFSEDKENQICQDLSWKITVSPNENKRAFRPVSHFWAFQQRCFSETPTENKKALQAESQSKKSKRFSSVASAREKEWKRRGISKSFAVEKNLKASAALPFPVPSEDFQNNSTFPSVQQNSRQKHR